MNAAAGPVLIIDTATTRCVVALAGPTGETRAVASWDAGYRHGETLLPAIERLLADEGVDRTGLASIVVGTGPGAFTGLHVGIATAKGLAHGLDCPLIGASTADALLAAARRLRTAAPSEAPTGAVLLLPAGPSDRIVVRAGSRGVLLVGGHDPELAPGEWLVAVDLDGRAPADAVDRGAVARESLAAELAVLGAALLRAQGHGEGGTDAMADLVPDYVTLPRGVLAEQGEVAWSRDPR